MKKNSIVLLLIIIFVFVLTSCGGGGGSGSDNDEVISLSPIIGSVIITPLNPTDKDTLICTVSASDADGDLFSIEFIWTDEVSTLQKNTLQVENSGSFSDSLDASKVTASAKITCQVTVTDKTGLSTQAQQNVQVQVAETENNPPFFFSSIPDISIFIGEKMSPVDMWEHVSDEEDSFTGLKITLTQTNPEVISCSLLEGVISSDESQAIGSSSITVQVTASDGATVSETFTITIKELPDEPPEINIPDQIVFLDDAMSPLDLSLFTSDSKDKFDDLLLEILEQTNPEVIICSLLEGVISSEESSLVGSSDVTIQVTDNDGKTASNTFSITVIENSPPEIGKIEDQEVLLGETIIPTDIFGLLSDDRDTPSDLLVVITQTNEEMMSCYLDNFVIKSFESVFSGRANVTITVTDSNGLSASETFKVTVAPVPVIYKLTGLNLNPLISGQTPGDEISEEQLNQRVGIVFPYTNWIKIPLTSGVEASGRIAHEFGLNVIMTAQLGKDKSTNQKEIEDLIDAVQSGYVDIAMIGSNVLFRGDLTEIELIEYINQFKAGAPWFPVVYEDTYAELLKHPNVISNCNIIFMNYFPHQEGIHINNAIAKLDIQREDMVMFRSQGKEVWIVTGWPSRGETIGEAVPNPGNASRYFQDFISWTKAKGVSYCYSQAFDNNIKDGIWDETINIKPGMEGVFLGE